MSTPALDLCARRSCFGCGRSETWLCDRCAGDLAPPGEQGPIEGVTAVHCPWAYDGAARDLVLALKLRARRDVATPLVDAMGKSVRRNGSVATVVTWVPARRRDIRLRGFDHARVLGEGVATSLGLPVRALLFREADRPDQAGLSASERRTNPLGAFGARPCAGTVMVVDDLITSGATASACAAALISAGADRVEVATSCRV